MKDTIFFQTKSFSEIKEIDGEVLIEGFASTKDIDRYGDIVEPKAFKTAIEHFMKTNPIMLLQHNQDKPIGKFIEATITSKGLKVKGTITNDIDNIKQNVKDGVIKGFSIGFIVKAWKFDTKDGQEVRVITDLELLEISAVAVPANPFTLFQAVKKYFTTINEKDMSKENIIEEEILDEEVKENAPEQEQNGDITEDEKTTEIKEEKVEEEIEEEKDAGEAHELHNEVSDNSEKSVETTDDSTETETEEATENVEETVEEEKDGEDDKEVDLKSAVTELLEIVEKQAEIIEKQQTAIDKVGLKKGLATISTKETEQKNSGNNAWLKTFQSAKKNITY